MNTPEELAAVSDDLKAQLLRAANRCPWGLDGAAGEADLIKNQAGEHGPLVPERLRSMLTKHRRYFAKVAADE